MPRRTFWLATGAALGVGSTLWAERKVRRSVQQAAARLQPDALVAEVGRTARQAAGSAGWRVREAVASGRDEMLRREEELWSELARPDAAVEAPRPLPPVPRADPVPYRRRRGSSGSGRAPARSAPHLGK